MPRRIDDSARGEGRVAGGSDQVEMIGVAHVDLPRAIGVGVAAHAMDCDVVSGQQAVCVGADQDEVARRDPVGGLDVQRSRMCGAHDETGGGPCSGADGTAQAEGIVVDAIDDPASVGDARGHDAANVDAISGLKTVACGGDDDRAHAGACGVGDRQSGSGVVIADERGDEAAADGLSVIVIRMIRAEADASVLGEEQPVVAGHEQGVGGGADDAVDSVVGEDGSEQAAIHVGPR